MRSSLSPFAVVVIGALAAVAVVAGCSTPGQSGATATRGERFFMTKCNACHPNGGQGAGPAIELSMAADFLQRGVTSGRHGVPEADWEPLLAHLQVRLGGGVAVAGAAPGVAPVGSPVAVAPVQMLPAPTSGDPAAGGSYFQNKCAKCHPGGSRIIGKSVPGPLVAGGGGKHGIAADQFDNVLAYLSSIGAVRVGAAAPVMAPVAVYTAPPTATPVPVTTVAVASSGDAAAGGTFFQTKCAKCHPNGNKVTGRTIPGVLVAGGSGKHGVPSEQFENLLSYLTTIGAVRAGAAPVAAAPTGVPVTTTTPPVAPMNNGVIPMNAGMVNCSCACQCPANTPPEALPAACLCQCQCPR